MRSLVNKYPYWFFLSVISLLLLIFALSAYFFKLSPRENFEIPFIYYVTSLIISVFVILVAYFQSQEALTQSKTNYLLKIDENWSSSEIIKARRVIHEFYLLAQSDNTLTQEQINFAIGQQILRIRNENTPEAIEKFISLLNFLDFLETIGYLYNRNSLLIKDIHELSGNSVCYFYEIFKPYILHRRKKDPMFYKMFENLYLDLCKYCNSEEKKI